MSSHYTSALAEVTKQALAHRKWNWVWSQLWVGSQKDLPFLQFLEVTLSLRLVT